MIEMKECHRLTIEQMSGFLATTTDLELKAASSGEGRGVVAEVLTSKRYGALSKVEKGIVRAYLMRVTGYGRAQIARWIAQYRREGEWKPSPSRSRGFPAQYTAADVALLAKVDAAHEGLSGAAIRRLFLRSYEVFGDSAYQRLAYISVSHIYNLRKSERYRRQRTVYRPTQASPVAIAERRCPEPGGKPGWLRVDTVHQGDPRDGQAGLYHINAIDTVTQWQVVGCVETISETHMLPVLEAMLHQMPFSIQGFHSDNGSEFLNYRVAAMLEKLRIEFTKSRANRSTDNALVEGKNGAVIRKYIGYGHLAAIHADAFQRFYTAHLNPYLNYHRPCGFAVVTTNERGKRRRRYPADNYRTPYEKLCSIPDWEQYLKPGITTDLLRQKSTQRTDLESALHMQQNRNELLTRCRADKTGSGVLPV